MKLNGTTVSSQTLMQTVMAQRQRYKLRHVLSLSATHTRTCTCALKLSYTHSIRTAVHGEGCHPSHGIACPH